MPQTYLTQLSHFADFLLAYTHTLLHLRGIYPHASFVRARFHNTPVSQSRHPDVCTWIRDAVQAVHQELLKGTVARIGIVVYSYGDDGIGRSGAPRILERYMFDVSNFPVLDNEEMNMPLEWAPAEGEEEDRALEDDGMDERGRAEAEARKDMKANVDMAEQFRAALLTLNSRCTQLPKLPEKCSFNICMELKDDPEIDPPLGHPQPWVPVQGNLQKAGRNFRDAERVEEQRRRAHDMTVTPVRAVEAGVLKFETWIERPKEKEKDGGAERSSVFANTPG